jgi:hypothetical protein
MSINSLAMSAQRRQTVEANLFPFARTAVEPWESFRWHGSGGEMCDTWKEHSSQALAIDLFGTLKLSATRDQVLDVLAADLGLPAGGPWQVELEWHDDTNVLREKQPTWVDATARSPHCLIFFECKFCETNGGTCSQTRPLASGRRKGTVQCNGHYAWQVNPANGREARCALSAKGIRYWEEITRVFDYDANSSYAPCPFAGPWFQWMRNITCCTAVAREAGLKPAFVVAYAAGPGLAMQERIRQPDWQRFIGRLHSSAITFRTLSVQQIVGLARQAAAADCVWSALEVWVMTKIANVCGRRMQQPNW